MMSSLILFQFFYIFLQDPHTTLGIGVPDTIMQDIIDRTCTQRYLLEIAVNFDVLQFARLEREKKKEQGNGRLFIYCTLVRKNFLQLRPKIIWTWVVLPMTCFNIFHNRYYRSRNLENSITCIWIYKTYYLLLMNVIW